jgi:hypothetical protein
VRYLDGRLDLAPTKPGQPRARSARCTTTQYPRAPPRVSAS